MKTSIHPEEFYRRIKGLQKRMALEKFDVIITFGDEAEPQYVRYFSDYWPSFETAGVFIPASGDATLLIGPESQTFASAWSKLKKIRRLKEYRESSEPEYPGEVLTTQTIARSTHRKIRKGELVQIKEHHAERYMLYGPCHGTGLMEGEHPWIEKDSDFVLQENMTFCVDNFLRTERYGLRWEDVVRITRDGVEEFTDRFQEVLVIK